jgi:PAT family beta-lactamase induction signal transducer AmpG
VIALTVGGIGGIAISKDGLGKMDVTYVFSHALTNYWFCVASHFHPSSVYYVYATVIAEQFDMVLVLLPHDI